MVEEASLDVMAGEGVVVVVVVEEAFLDVMVGEGLVVAVENKEVRKLKEQ